ncbi:MAG: hypothetical protein ACYCY2_14240 [Acidithiobacillus ferriphilus]
MKTKITSIALLATVLSLAGCSGNGPHGGHSEKWYEKHNAARQIENKWCAGQSFSTQIHSKSCERSGQAENVITLHRSMEQSTRNMCTQPGLEQSFGPKLYQTDCPGYNLQEHKIAK